MKKRKEIFNPLSILTFFFQLFLVSVFIFCMYIFIHYGEMMLERVFDIIIDPLTETIFKEVLIYPIGIIIFLLFLLGDVMITFVVIIYFLFSWGYAIYLYLKNRSVEKNQVYDAAEFRENSILFIYQPFQFWKKTISSDFGYVFFAPLFNFLFIICYLLMIVLYDTFKYIKIIHNSHIFGGIFIVSQVLYIIPQNIQSPGLLFDWNLFTQYFIIGLFGALKILIYTRERFESIHYFPKWLLWKLRFVMSIVYFFLFEMVLIQFIFVPYSVLLIIVGFIAYRLFDKFISLPR